MTSLNQIEVHLRAALKKLWSLSDEDLSELQLTLNTDKQKQSFGDLSTNAALVLSKKVGEPPRIVAQKIIDHLLLDSISNMSIAGPGFINIFLTHEAFVQLAKELFEQKAHFFSHTTGLKRSYNVEFVSANPTGPLHIGHGRGGIIGDVLSRVLSFLGHNVVKEYYINDAGSQMQKLGRSLKVRCLQVAGQTAELSEDSYQGDYLISLAQECYTTFGEELFTKPDTFFIDYAKDHLLNRIKETLGNYGITYDIWFSEKMLHESSAIEQVLDQLTRFGHLYTQDSTIWLRTTAFGDDKDRVVRKGTGELTYIAADIAYTQDKVARGFDHLIYILGQDHHSYVKRLKVVMEALGYDPERLSVILYQLVTVKEGGQALRLSKRAGRIVTLEDIINTVGVDVARFFYLHTKADAHLDFDLELALKHTDENPVYYIQYAYVRTQSIIKKARHDTQFHMIKSDDLKQITESEHLLLKKITGLKEILSSIEKNYQTHKITYYAIELAQTFHTYYAHHKVIDPDKKELSRARLAVIQLVGETLQLTFTLLGISAPEKM